MFEEAIMELDAMGVDYSETEDGGLIIDIENVDKTDLVTIISFLNDNGIAYNIDATSITVEGMGAEEDMLEDDMGMEDDLGLPPMDLEEFM